ncbi:MAG: hypothetical protein HRU38_24810 [Saccharospirillaceae bacterium]|nr:hypothetical protein [Saccharospirillaceae bacterium]
MRPTSSAPYAGRYVSEGSKMDCCSILEDRFEGKMVKDILELNNRLIEIKTDYKNWKTIYKCSSCNQTWIEKYSTAGHGSIPEIYKSES